MKVSELLAGFDQILAATPVDTPPEVLRTKLRDYWQANFSECQMQQWLRTREFMEWVATNRERLIEKKYR